MLDLLRRPLRSLSAARWLLLVIAAVLVALAVATSVRAWLLVQGAPWKTGEPETFTVMVAAVAGAMRSPREYVLASVTWACCSLSLVAAMLAGWIAARSSGTRATFQMGALLAGAAALLLLRVAPEVAARTWGVPAFWKTAHLAAGWSIGLYLLVGLARFLVLFPREVDAADIEPIYAERRPWARMLGRTGPAVPVRLLAAWHRALLRGWAPLVAAALPFAVWVLHGPALHVVSQDTWGALNVLGCVWLLAGFFMSGLPWAIASLTHVRRHGTEEEQHRVAVLRATMLALLGTLLVACLVIPALFALPAPPPPPANTKPAVPWVMVVLMLDFLYLSLLPEISVIVAAISVLRGGALDAHVVFTRTMGWSLLGLLVTALFLVLERFVAAEIVRWLGLAADSGALVAGAFVALTFMPLRRAVSRGVELLAKRWVPAETRPSEAPRVRRLAPRRMRIARRRS